MKSLVRPKRVLFYLRKGGSLKDNMVDVSGIHISFPTVEPWLLNLVKNALLQ